MPKQQVPNCVGLVLTDVATTFKNLLIDHGYRHREAQNAVNAVGSALEQYVLQQEGRLIREVGQLTKELAHLEKRLGGRMSAKKRRELEKEHEKKARQRHQRCREIEHVAIKWLVMHLCKNGFYLPSDPELSIQLSRLAEECWPAVLAATDARTARRIVAEVKEVVRQQFDGVPVRHRDSRIRDAFYVQLRARGLSMPAAIGLNVFNVALRLNTKQAAILWLGDGRSIAAGESSLWEVAVRYLQHGNRTFDPFRMMPDALKRVFGYPKGHPDERSNYIIKMMCEANQYLEEGNHLTEDHLVKITAYVIGTRLEGRDPTQVNKWLGKCVTEVYNNARRGANVLKASVITEVLGVVDTALC